MNEISKEDMHMIRERLDAVRDMFRHGQLMMDNVAEYAALNDVPALLARIEALETENARLQEVAQEATKEYLALRLNLAAAKHEAEKLVQEEKERHRGPVLSKEVIDKFLGDDHGQ